VFRVDASRELGIGHVMRCLALAGEVQARGAHTRFLCRDVAGNLIERIRDAGHDVAVIGARDELVDAAECAALLPAPADCIVVDHYGLGADWERALRSYARRVLVIEDLIDRRHECDVLLDQNLRGEDDSPASDRAPAGALQLLGPRYALLQGAYAMLRALLPARVGRVARVLVFFGGSDTTNETAKALQALAAPEFGGLAVDVVVGPNHPAVAQIRALVEARANTTLHCDLPTLAGLMARADLAIGAGGTTSWERICLKLPAIVTTIAANQVPGVRALAAAGDVRWRGEAAATRPRRYADALRAALSGSVEPAPLVDGFGARRVAEWICPTPVAALTLRPATLGDAEHLFSWRRDPLAQAMSFSSQPIEWNAHVEWMRRKLAADDCVLRVAEAGGLPVGQVRFDLGASGNVLSYSLDPLVRGRGWSRWLITTAIASTPRLRGREVMAEIKPENEASIRVFTRLGWRHAGQVDGRVRFFHAVPH
jgi:UDP-2,4-diacetamido-2,4,6-trideoxy-beta-L-altropyranose hydrolase